MPRRRFSKAGSTAGYTISAFQRSRLSSDFFLNTLYHIPPQRRTGLLDILLLFIPLTTRRGALSASARGNV